MLPATATVSRASSLPGLAAGMAGLAFVLRKGTPDEPVRIQYEFDGPVDRREFLAGFDGRLDPLVMIGDDVELTKKLTKIGKDFSNDIVISGGFTVGQTAATISKMPDGFYLSYVGGMSKPKLNGKPVSGSRLLTDFDNIEIGSAKFQFFIKEQK